MTARKSQRVENCGRPEALVRLTQACQFVEVAKMVLGDVCDESLPGVAGSLAVLAGIAAADAACCAKLHKRLRGQNHLGAADLVATVSLNGAAMANDLRRLFKRKVDARFVSSFLSSTAAKEMVTWAQRLITASRRAVES